jgi:soluble lytic murein transglycosylase-like protein
MSAVKIPIEATFAAGAVEAELDKLTQKINQLGASFAKVSGEQWNPISRVAVADIQKMTEQFERLKKAAPNVRDALNKAGQGKADYFDVDWDKVFTSAITRSATRYGAFRKTIEGVGDGGFSPIRPNPSPGEGGAGGAGGGNGPGTTWGSAGRRILGSGMRAMGGAGGAAADAMEGAAGGMAGPLILADLAAKGIGAVVGMIKDKVSSAYQLDVGYDTLKRQLGDVGVGFERLKVSLENTADANGATLQETQAVASAFAKAAGVFGEQAKSLAGDAGVAIGFARSFGIDPTTAGQFFGQMRKMGASSDENGSKKLALMIGESVAKAGISTQMPEVLAALSDFTQQQTRMGMAAANQAGYLGEFAGLAGSRTPGTDPQAVASMLSTINSSIQHGGNLGEASQNLMYGALGRPNNLTPEQTLLLQEQGMFGTAASVFGKDSEYARYVSRNGGALPSLGASSTKMNYQSVMDSLKGRYSGDMLINAVAQTFGLSNSQAMKYIDTDPTDVSGVAKRMQRLHLDMSKLNANGIEKTTNIEANKNLSEAQKDAQIKDAYEKNQEKTDASEMRDGLDKVNNSLIKAADSTIPLLSGMLTGILYLAGKGTISQKDMALANAKAEYNDAMKPLDERKKALQQQLAPKVAGLESNRASTAAAKAAMVGVDAQIAAVQKSYDDTVAGINNPTSPAAAPAADASTFAGTSPGAGASSLRNDPWLIAQAAETDRLDGLPPGTTMAQFSRESTFNPTARSGKGAMGLAQLMPKTRAGLEQQLGRKLNPDDPHDAVIIQRELMRQNMAKFHNVPDALRAYNSGWNPEKWNNPETNGYVADIMGRAKDFAGTKMPMLPDGGRASAATSANGGSSGPQEMRFTFTHLDAKGKPIPTIKTAFNMPTAQGAN